MEHNGAARPHPGRLARVQGVAHARGSGTYLVIECCLRLVAVPGDGSEDIA
jgi:hypothetical protein